MRKIIYILAIVFIFLCACSQAKKSQVSSNKKSLPLYYEIVSAGMELNKFETKQYSSSITMELKEKGKEVITKEDAVKLLQDEIQDIFDYYKGKDLSLEKYKDEAAKKMNQIPSVAQKMTFKFFRTNMKIDSIYIISGLFTNIVEKMKSDSLCFTNKENLSANLFIKEVIDSCDGRMLFK